MESPGYDHLVGITGGASRRPQDAERDLYTELKRAGEETAARLAASEAAGQLPVSQDKPPDRPGADTNPYGSLPDGMALLTVNEERKSQSFLVQGWCCPECGELEPDQFNSYGRPPVQLDELVTENGLLPAEIVDRLQVWSSYKEPIADWLNRCRGRHRSDFRLVIWDQTSYHIPWELLWLKAAADLDSGWLGAVLTVTRWLDPHHTSSDRGDFRSAYRCEGQAAAYLHETMDHHIHLLAAFEPVLYGRTMTELAAELNRSQKGPLSLVYVACEARFSEQTSGSALADLRIGGAYSADFRRLWAPAQTLVFLNASYSGAIAVSTREYGQDARPSGFPHAFLRGGAVGVLATGGKVEPGDAYRMARDLLKYLETHSGVSVAEAMRVLRQEAVRVPDLNPVPTGALDSVPAGAVGTLGPEDGDSPVPAHYPFMYVYYGSPFAELVVPEAAE
jgi:hypothetical protein